MTTLLQFGFLLAFFCVANAAGITSEYSFIRLENGVSREVNLATIECTNQSPGPFQYEVTNNNNNQPMTITIECLPPEEEYSSNYTANIPHSTYVRRVTSAAYIGNGNVSQSLLSAIEQAARNADERIRTGGPAQAPRHAAARVVPRSVRLSRKMTPVLLSHLEQIERTVLYSFNRTCHMDDLRTANIGYDFQEKMELLFRSHHTTLGSLREHARREMEHEEAAREHLQRTSPSPFARHLLQEGGPGSDNYTINATNPIPGIQRLPNITFTDLALDIYRSLENEEYFGKLDTSAFGNGIGTLRVTKAVLAGIGPLATSLVAWRFATRAATLGNFVGISKSGAVIRSTAVANVKSVKTVGVASRGALLGGGALTVGLAAFTIYTDIVAAQEEAAWRKSVVESFQMVRNILVEQSKFNRLQITFNRQVQEQFRITSDAIDRTADAVATIRRTIQSIDVSVTALQTTVARLDASVEGRFATLEGNLTVAFNQSQAQIDALRGFIQNTNEEVSRINEYLLRLSDVAAKINKRVDDVATDVVWRRTLARDYWDAYDVYYSVIGGLLSYTVDMGIRPKSEDEMAALQTKEQAEVVATVFLSGTVLAGATRKATEYEISLICDKVELIEAVSREPTFSTIIALVGPQNCTNPNTTTSWTCRCAIRYATTTVDLLPGGGVFPFDWELDTNQTSYEIRTNPRLFVNTGVASLPAKEYRYATDFADFTRTFMRDFVCDERASVLSPAWITAADVRGDTTRRMRFINPVLNEFIDSSLNTALLGGISSFCNSNFVFFDALRQANSSAPIDLAPMVAILNNLLMGFAWRMNEGNDREIDLYGSSGQVTERCQHTSQLPTSLRVTRICTQNFAQLLATNPLNPGGTPVRARTLPVMALNRNGRKQKIRVTVNGGAPVDMEVDVGNPTNRTGAGSFAMPTGTAVLYSDFLFVSEAQRLMPETMHWIGTEEGYKDPEFHFFTQDTPGGPLTYTGDPEIVYDVPFEQYSGAVTGRSRAGRVDYIRQTQSSRVSHGLRLGTSDIMNMTEFIDQEGTTFDPRDAVSSASLYMRYFDPTPGSEYCTSHVSRRTMDEYYFGPNGTVTGLVGDDGSFDNEPCRIRRNFLLVPMMPLTTTPKVRFVYRPSTAWRVLATFELPKGPKTEIANSFCPDNSTVVYIPGASQALVTFTTERVDTGTVLYSVCRAAPSTDCLASNVQASYSRSAPLIVPFTDVSGDVYYLQMILPATGSRCFPQNANKGLSLHQTSSYGFASPNEVYDLVYYREDETKKSFISVATAIMLLINDITSSRYLSETRVTSLTQIYNNATGAVRKAIGDIPGAGADSTGFAAFLNQTLTLLNDEAAKRQADYTRMEEIERDLRKFAEGLRNISKEQDLLVTVQEIVANRSDLLLRQFTSKINELKKKAGFGDFPGLGGFPDFGGFDAIGDIIGWIADVVSEIYEDVIECNGLAALNPVCIGASVMDLVYLIVKIVIIGAVVIGIIVFVRWLMGKGIGLPGVSPGLSESRVTAIADACAESKFNELMRTRGVPSTSTREGSTLLDVRKTPSW